MSFLSASSAAAAGPASAAQPSSIGTAPAASGSASAGLPGLETAASSVSGTRTAATSEEFHADLQDVTASSAVSEHDSWSDLDS